MSDVKKREGDRSVSFIDTKVAAWLRDAAPAVRDGLCLARFHADYEAEGVCSWNAGDVVRIQSADDVWTEFEVTLTGKRCFPECGLLQRTGAKCPLADGVAFGRPAVPEDRR